MNITKRLEKLETDARGRRSGYEGKGEPQDIGYYDGKADAYFVAKKMFEGLLK